MAKAEMRDKDQDAETKELAEEASEDGHREAEEPAGERKRGGAMHKRARGGHLDGAKEHKTDRISKRKRGGKVHGEAAMERPDRRARGGGTSDTNPLTSAGNVSMPSYETKSSTQNGGGVGPDKNAYAGGGRRRPS